ncbi:MAG: sigma-54-dependent Fis family transcriptional regulator [Desulfobacteraceae bacterium]|nr:sigma-54-dependent Fis family transcriptional regulator [Desulfobacteraceae bacterium]MBC2758047.1 sigma-54-dependent Fis family transcriptional regulator [Desulfobacteraceae bacterium]
MKNILNPQKTILIVDDDPNVLEVLNARLASQGFLVFQASGGTEALNIIKKEPIGLMISDIKMPGMGGIDLFSNVRSLKPFLPVIFLTAYGTIPDAVSAVKAGAVDYLTKPFDGQDLVKKIHKILKGSSIDIRKNNILPSPTDQDFYWGTSASMKTLFDLVKRVSASHVNVLVLGDSGVGKERIARLIHELGPRKDNPFIVVDCGSTPTGLLESELFGHIKGAFTHAIRDKKGLIEAADQGTLFLDEVGNISQDMQVRLLRFLEDRKIRKIGSITEIPVDCRVISATNSDLLDDIESENFRQDLYYRLRVVTIRVPTLNERQEDIPYLARHFVDRYCNTHGIPRVTLPPKTIEWLHNYPWPGNVRELKNALEAGVVLCHGGVLKPSNLQLDDKIKGRSRSSIKKGALSLEESEHNTIIRALVQTGGVQKQAAELLGISRRSIHYKIKKYGIEISKISKS